MNEAVDAKGVVTTDVSVTSACPGGGTHKAERLRDLVGHDARVLEARTDGRGVEGELRRILEVPLGSREPVEKVLALRGVKAEADPARL